MQLLHQGELVAALEKLVTSNDQRQATHRLFSSTQGPIIGLVVSVLGRFVVSRCVPLSRWPHSRTQ